MAAAQLPRTLAGAVAKPLPFLDFLICQPIRGVLLQGARVPVNVPPPELFSIPKLIVASRRRTEKEGFARTGTGGTGIDLA
ncbi:GSU2403 family nucleotidyltransferase fold protein [Nitratireductor thuwali]|uniref:GSU2403 family nucleotidyltransferase fold protein n=1 Tax=Nitratireductor thuwali TaxID=2267699 RepID=UPI003BB07A5F